MKTAVYTRGAMHAAVCGDVARVWRFPGGLTACVVDGTGHGESAREVALLAADYIGEHYREDVGAIVDGCDEALAGSRGVVICVAQIDAVAGWLNFAGVGDASASIHRSHRMTSLALPVQPGTVGTRNRTVRKVVEPLNDGDVLVMHSDGITSRIDVAQFDDITFGDPDLLAETITNNHWRTNDDASVVVVRYSPDD
jgi:hypothetical protein